MSGLGRALDRLSATSVSISDGPLTYFGALIEEAMRDEDTGKAETGE